LFSFSSLVGAICNLSHAFVARLDDPLGWIQLVTSVATSPLFAS